MIGTTIKMYFVSPKTSPFFYFFQNVFTCIISIDVIMTKNILIIGLKNNDSGKISLARAIISYLRDKNYKTCGFKPFSGNNIWYDFDKYLMQLFVSKLWIFVSKYNNIIFLSQSF